MDTLPAILAHQVQPMVLRQTVRREIAHAVLSKPVVREADTDMFADCHRDGVVRLALAEDGVELFAHGILPRSGEIADFILRDRNEFQCKLVALLELAVYIDDSAAVVTHGFRAQHSLVHAVFRRDGGVKAQVAEICAVPDGVSAVTPGYFGKDGAVKACTVCKWHFLDQGTVCLKAQGEGFGLLRQPLHSHIFLKGDGFSLALDGEAVETGIVCRDKEVAFVFTCSAAGNRARKLGLFQDFHQRVAPGDQARAVVLIACRSAVAVADHTTDIALAAEAALGAAAFDGAV